MTEPLSFLGRQVTGASAKAATKMVTPGQPLPVAPGGYTPTKGKTDFTALTGRGTLHTVTISQDDAAPTAGTIDIYDGTDANGTLIFSWTLTTAVFIPFTLTFDVDVTTGIFVDFTTTADVNVTTTHKAG